MATAVDELALGRREPRTAHEGPREVGPQLGGTGQLLLGRSEDPPRIAEGLQQVHGALDADARGHLQGNAFENHRRRYRGE